MLLLAVGTEIGVAMGTEGNLGRSVFIEGGQAHGITKGKIVVHPLDACVRVPFGHGITSSRLCESFEGFARAGVAMIKVVIVYFGDYVRGKRFPSPFEFWWRVRNSLLRHRLFTFFKCAGVAVYSKFSKLGLGKPIRYEL